MDHPRDAFSSMAKILGKNLYFRKEPYKKPQTPKDSINMWKSSQFMDVLQYKICPLTYTSGCMDSYGWLLADAVHSVPVELLGSLLHEEISQQMMFCEANTGGALDFIPFTHSAGDAPQFGCLVYPTNGLDKLNFQQVEVQSSKVVCSTEAFSFLVKGPIKQINSSSIGDCTCVAVRSLYHCGLWMLSQKEQPRLLQCVSNKEETTCVSTSPHVLGEVLVASESGAAHLWTVGRGMQQVRTEDSNLYFNARSSWRWCEFSSHPRVMLYADRTGVELTDIRVEPAPCHTLFRISKASECCSGERLLTCRYLSGVHSFHHLISTQYSAYIMDERFPCVPVLKIDHMMEAPPIFCHCLTGPAPSVGGGATKVLLGSQSSQEVTLLQYSGGRAEACMSRGPPQALLRPRDSLELLPAQIPHRMEAARSRLSVPAAGLTCVQQRANGSRERFCIFQLLQTGDVFYQVLEKDTPPDEPQADPTSPVASDTWSYEDVYKSERNQPMPDKTDYVDLERAVLKSRQLELKLSQEALSIWKQWLQKLVKKTRDVNQKKTGNLTVNSVLHMSKSKSEEAYRVKIRQQDLKRSMSERSLFVASEEEILPLTDHVYTETWTDDLSRRLTGSWDSEGAWHTWWAEHLDTNKPEKMAALRRKRKKEKEARRATGRSLLALSDRFTSSISYQSELSDVSDSTGWAWSEAGGAGSLSEGPPIHASHTDWQISSATVEKFPAKPRSLQETPSQKRQQDLYSQLDEIIGTHTPVSMATVTPGKGTTVKPLPHAPTTRLESTPTSRRRRRVADYLSSVNAQAERSEQAGWDLEESSLFLRSSKASSLSQTVSVKPVDFSQEAFTGCQTSSQSSLGRLSQPSQSKKKSRMGF